MALKAKKFLLNAEIRRFDVLTIALLGTMCVAAAALEAQYPLRRRTARQDVRVAVNGTLSLLGLPVLRMAMLPLSLRLARNQIARRAGLLNRVKLHPMMKETAAFLALDYSAYIWHRLLHSTLLWRFHVVHHIDPDMDTSTGLRFHFGEMLATIPFRLLIVRLLGPSPRQLMNYELIFQASTIFHHSNLRLPWQFESIIHRIVVSPRMHEVHHSQRKMETWSNFSVVLSIWDRIHGTHHAIEHFSRKKIGVPSYSDASENAVAHLIDLPFGEIRPWHPYD